MTTTSDPGPGATLPHSNVWEAEHEKLTWGQGA